MPVLPHDRLGSGPPVVLLPGIAARRQGWEPVIHRISTHCEVVNVDLPGMGGAEALAESRPPTVAAFTDVVARFLAEVGLERPHVAGNSLGGAIALELARRGLVASATAIAPIGFWSTREARYVRWKLLGLRWLALAVAPFSSKLSALRGARKLGYWMLLEHPERISPQDAQRDGTALARAHYIAYTLPHTTAYRFEAGDHLSCPVAVLWGDRDRLLPPHQACRARRLLPQAAHLRLEDAGHLAMLDRPDRVAELILEVVR
jgi:pimeloyl-ACP methyl ester carboxylesterase